MAGLDARKAAALLVVIDHCASQVHTDLDGIRPANEN